MSCAATHSRSLIIVFDDRLYNHWILQNIWMNSECPNHTARMRKIVWIFAVRI